MIHVLHSITSHYFYYFYYEQPHQQLRHDTSGLGAQGSLTTKQAAKIRPWLRDLFRGLDLVSVLENFPALCTQGSAWAKFFKDETKRNVISMGVTSQKNISSHSSANGGGDAPQPNCCRLGSAPVDLEDHYIFPSIWNNQRL